MLRLIDEALMRMLEEEEEEEEEKKEEEERQQQPYGVEEEDQPQLAMGNALPAGDSQDGTAAQNW